MVGRPGNEAKESVNELPGHCYLDCVCGIITVLSLNLIPSVATLPPSSEHSVT